MYLISSISSDFSISFQFKNKPDHDEFYDHVNYLKSKFLFYNSEVKMWEIPRNRIEELLHHFEKDRREYEITSSANEMRKEIVKNISSKIQYFRNASFDTSLLNSGVKLFDFQKESIDWMLGKSRCYNADDPGLGKTIQSICTFSQWYKEGKIDSVFIFCRNALQYHWKREILNFSNVFKDDDIQLITNDNKEKIFDEYQDKKILIVSSHLCADIFLSYKASKDRYIENSKGNIVKKKKSSFRWSRSFFDILKQWNRSNCCLVVDEAHEFKNLSAVRTKALHCFKDFFNFRILLSATPAINAFEDWYSGINFIDESIIGSSYIAFKIDIAQEIGDRFSPYTIKSYNIEAIERFKNRFSPFVIKRLKSDLIEMKTKQIVKPIYLSMTEEQRKLYQTFLQYEIYKLEKEFDSISLKLIFQKWQYLLQIIDNVELLKGKVENQEFNLLLDRWDFETDLRFVYLKYALKDYITGLNEKVIIFDTHPLTLNLLNEKFQKYKPIILHGQTNDNAEERQRKQDLFNDKNSENKLFLLSTLIGGAGLNLQYACHRIIFWSLPTDATLTRQSMDRIYRITSTEDAIVEMLVLDHSIDNIRYNRNMNRMELNDNLLNGNLSREQLKNLFNGIL